MKPKASKGNKLSFLGMTASIFFRKQEAYRKEKKEMKKLAIISLMAAISLTACSNGNDKADSMEVMKNIEETSNVEETTSIEEQTSTEETSIVEETTSIEEKTSVKETGEKTDKEDGITVDVQGVDGELDGDEYDEEREKREGESTDEAKTENYTDIGGDGYTDEEIAQIIKEMGLDVEVEATVTPGGGTGTGGTGGTGTGYVDPDFAGMDTSAKPGTGGDIQWGQGDYTGLGGGEIQ